MHIDPRIKSTCWLWPFCVEVDVMMIFSYILNTGVVESLALNLIVNVCLFVTTEIYWQPVWDVPQLDWWTLWRGKTVTKNHNSFMSVFLILCRGHGESSCCGSEEWDHRLSNQRSSLLEPNHHWIQAAYCTGCSTRFLNLHSILGNTTSLVKSIFNIIHVNAMPILQTNACMFFSPGYRAYCRHHACGAGALL